MESLNLRELPRKELKLLCNEHNIRTAGVKHDDLVRLLRNKMYPLTSDPPRLPKARSQLSTDSQISSKSTSEGSEKTPRSATSQGRSQRSLLFVDDSSRDNTPERSTKELSPCPALPRKPVLSKANSAPARRSDFLIKKVNTLSGLGKQSQERRPQQSGGSSDKVRNNVGAQWPSIRNTSMAVKRPNKRPAVKINEAQNAQTNADAYSEAASSPRASEGDASVTAMDSSDLGSHSFRSVSKIGTDARHHAISEESDNDDGRSVSSEPASKFTSQISKLAPHRSAGRKLSRGVYSSWDSEQESDSLDSFARNNGVHGQDSDLSAAHDGEESFPYFLEDADSLVGDTDGLDSFFDARIADPEDVYRADRHQVDSEQFRTPEISRARYQENDIFDREGSMREEVAIGEPENLSGIGLIHDLYDSPSLSGQEKLVEASEVLLDPVHFEEQDYESSCLRVKCNRVSEEGVADEQSPKNFEDLTEMLTIANEASEHTQAAFLSGLLSEKIGNDNDSSKLEYSRVVVTTAHSDFENANHGNSEDRTPAYDASDYVPEDIQDAKFTPKPGENRSDMKWSFVSALYDDLDDVHNTVDIDSYGLLEHKLAEAGEPGNYLTQDSEPLKHQSGPESETVNYAEPAAIVVERYGGEDKENVGTVSSSLVEVIQGWDPSPNEIASKSDEHKEVENILQDGTTRIARKSDSYPPDMCTTGGEATCDGHEHEGTGSSLSIPLDFDSLCFSNVPKESDVVLNVSEHNIKPFSWSIDKDEETVKPDDLLRSSANEVSGANSSVSAEGESTRSFTLVQETLEGLREENTSETSTEMEEETETWSAYKEEDLGAVSIQTLALAGETGISTGLKEHESPQPSSEDQDGVLLQGDKHSLGLKHLSDLVPDKEEKTSHDNTAATSHPRKMKQILSVGLKMIFVIGSITFGILRLRASRLR